MLCQHQRAGLKDHDLQTTIGKFDSGRHAAGAAANYEAVDGRRRNCARVAQQDGSKRIHYSAAFSRDENALPTFQKAEMMSSTSLSVSTEETVRSAARSASESQFGKAPRS